ncbi:MAG: hypothetical protein AB7O47_12105 [Flavobacteriales bacterium]
MLNKIIRFFLENKLIAVLTLFLFVGWGIATAPFNWETRLIPRDPVAVDAVSYPESSPIKNRILRAT